MDVEGLDSVAVVVRVLLSQGKRLYLSWQLCVFLKRHLSLSLWLSDYWNNESPQIGISPEIFMLSKRKSMKPYASWHRNLQKEISYSPDNLSDHLAGETGAETMASPRWTVHTLHASCPWFKSQPYARAGRMDLTSLHKDWVDGLGISEPLYLVPFSVWPHWTNLLFCFHSSCL